VVLKKSSIFVEASFAAVMTVFLDEKTKKA
jgi:hypothetical protein